jgi:hypothetical protein
MCEEGHVVRLALGGVREDEMGAWDEGRRGAWRGERGLLAVKGSAPACDRKRVHVHIP